MQKRGSIGYFIFLLIAMLFFAPFSFAADVVVQDGRLNVSDSFVIDNSAHPTYKGHLDFTGGSLTLKEQNSLTPYYPYIQWLDSTGTRAAFLGWGSKNAPKHLQLQLENGNNLYIDGGNVGIGTMSPGDKLVVSGTVRATSSAAAGLFAGNGGGLDGTTLQQFVLYADTTNGLYFDAPKDSAGNKLDVQFNWRGGGTPSLFIKGSTGNVGIGTTNPIAKLHIDHSETNSDITTTSLNYLRLQNAQSGGTYTGAIEFYTWDNKRNAGIFAERDPADGEGGQLSFATTNKGSTILLERVRISNTGNVGIGTSVPNYKLDVNGAIGTNLNNFMFQPSGGSIATDGTYGIYWHNSLGTTPSANYGIYRTSGAWTASTYQQLKMQFDTGIQLGAGTGVGTGYDKSYVEIVSGKGLMVTSGNVGIGITNPSKKLDVADTGTTDREGIITTREGHSTGLGVDRTGTLWGTGLYVDGAKVLMMDSNGGAGIGGGNYVGGNPPAGGMIIEGNVGIGTTGPNYKLDVNGNIVNSNPINGNLGLTGDLPGYAAGLHPTLKTSGTWMYFSASNAYSGYWGNSGLRARAFYDFDNEGYYTDPASTSVFNTVYATVYYYNSDIKLKKEIQQAKGLEVIRKLDGVSFKWKDTNKPELGFIAQDVEKVLPELVGENNGIKSVNYAGIIAPLVEAAKELDKSTKELELQNTEQNKKIEQLEKEINLLKEELKSKIS